MDQAKYYICESCMTPVPTGHKFCGRCGTNVPEDQLDPVASYFSDMQDPSKARLVLIRGDGMEGLSYHLKASQHVVGRTQQGQRPAHRDERGGGEEGRAVLQARHDLRVDDPDLALEHALHPDMAEAVHAAFQGIRTGG